jgi:Raf kinase inhibitor-like YbhB/YbcL family protein
MRWIQTRKRTFIVRSQNLSCSLRCLSLLLLVLVPSVIVKGHAGGNYQAKPDRKEPSMLHLTSTAFETESNIPMQYSCDGRNISPDLSWSGAPAGTKSFALVMHDPDAPVAGGYTHWLVYNVPSAADHIPENAPNQDRLPGGGMQGKNDSGTYGYTGPCPPSGTHRYYFRLYALDVELDPRAGTSKAAMEKSMQGHVLAQAELLGRYKRPSGKAA